MTAVLVVRHRRPQRGPVAGQDAFEHVRGVAQ
jgi:hypothetical protein